ncbi:glutathione S-transferase theta-1-like [Ruditapes philippinarum]|uniref:glutathione S-transferase theta-1-like n=1 Tax=Ruditapes philippinarum TaxID=129788 RepID=UPI00295AEFCC|nr:glutathione S-transferase theta-1-like [Ruditapes philippinarum]
MGLEFYYDLLSQPCRAVYFLLKCAKVDFKGCSVSLLKGEHLTPEFLKKNPYHKVPVIIDDGFALSESLAIMRYIVSKKKLPAQWFAADNPKNQARVDEFLSWQGSTIRSNCITVFQGMFRDKVGVLAFSKQPMDVEKVTAAKAEVTRSVTHLADYFLQDKQFIGGSKMSVADILGVCELYQLHAVNELDNLVKSNPKVKAWFERVVKAIGAEWTPGNVEIDSFREKYMKA